MYDSVCQQFNLHLLILLFFRCLFQPVYLLPLNNGIDLSDGKIVYQSHPLDPIGRGDERVANPSSEVNSVAMKIRVKNTEWLSIKSKKERRIPLRPTFPEILISRGQTDCLPYVIVRPDG